MFQSKVGRWEKQIAKCNMDTLQYRHQPKVEGGCIWAKSHTRDVENAMAPALLFPTPDWLYPGHSVKLTIRSAGWNEKFALRIFAPPQPLPVWLPVTFKHPYNTCCPFVKVACRSICHFLEWCRPADTSLSRKHHPLPSESIPNWYCSPDQTDRVRHWWASQDVLDISLSSVQG